MLIAIIAPGSRGDVEPYLALGKGLQAAGHTVRLVTHQNFETWVTAHGVEFWPISGDVQVVAQSADMRARLEKGNFLSVMSKMAREAENEALHMARGGVAACQDVDLLLGGVGGLFLGLALAEKLGLPFLQAYYIPFTPTRAYPSFLLPKLPSWSGRLLNPLSYHLARQVMWQGFRAADKWARQEVLELSAAPFWGPFDSDRLRHTPVLYGFSPAVIPQAPDWDDDTHVTGYWFLDSPAEWTPPEALNEFLQAGPPPVYVGFGSMGSRRPEETTKIILQALAQAEQRAIVLSGWGSMSDRDMPDWVLAIESAPFAWLFPRVTAVVHHGGAGTTAAGLRAGVPSIVVPFFADQPFWGRRVAGLGVGPAPIPRQKLTVDRLAQAIGQAVTEEGMRRRAAGLGARIRREDGVGRAVAIIEEFERGRTT